MRKINQGLFYLLFIGIIATSCSDSPSIAAFDPFDADRPHNPWVFRSVLDSQARMVTLALHEDLWAAYNTDDCMIYKVWKGHVHFDGAVYTTAHGPQPTTVGDSYIEPQNQQWGIRENGTLQSVKARYRGHSFVDNGVILKYTLTDNQGRSIEVNESPEYVLEDGQMGLVRKFTTTNVPPGVEIVLQTTISSIALESSLTTDATFDVVDRSEIKSHDISGLSMNGHFVLNTNGSSEIKTMFTKRPLIPNTRQKNQDAKTQVPLGQRLIAQSDCKTCHNKIQKTVGPSYLEIAQHYFNTSENKAMLINKISTGGAGVWGQAAMTPHPDISAEDLGVMVDYIMNLDSLEESKIKATIATNEDESSIEFHNAASDIRESQLSYGLRMKFFKVNKVNRGFEDFNFSRTAQAEMILPEINFVDKDLTQGGENFAMVFDGYIDIPSDDHYVFRLVSDDGSFLYINGKEIIDHDGFHGAGPKNGKVALRKGLHPIRVEFFQGAGGKSIQLFWKPFGDNKFEIVPSTIFKHHTENQKPRVKSEYSFTKSSKIAGDRYALEEMHPSFDVQQARPESFLPKVGGIDFLSDGRMVVSTWDPAGSIYLVDNHQSGDPSKINVSVYARGLAEPLGVKVVDDEIYVLQKQELTKPVDTNGDDIADDYQTLSNDWRTSGNFHEFAFGLEYKEGHFYATLATAIQPGGASTNPQIKDRGKVAKINKTTGEVEFIAHGLRTPNGIGIGVDGELFVADNQGDWLPSSKIVHVQDDAWYGSRSVDAIATEGLKETLPVVWLPQDEIGNSPSTPMYIDKGPYAGQMIHGEVTHGGIKRVFVEKVDGQYQGCVFRFMQGLEAGVNRLRWSPDGALYAGGIGSTGNWGHTGKLWYGLQRLEYNENSTFEMLAVRAKSNGLEIEFTEPLKDGDGWNTEDYQVRQWRYQPTENYGGPKIDDENLQISSASVSPDRKKVFLEIEGLKAGYQVVYLRLNKYFLSDQNHQLWTTEAWYTMNKIPSSQGKVLDAPTQSGHNTLTAREVAEGWKLLFDGQTTDGWKNYGKDNLGSDWSADDGILSLSVSNTDERDGGDIVTVEEYENFELSLEWKISSCGNSGIMFNVVDDGTYDHPFLTGPEMQILDNACHQGTPLHKAGALYDLIASKEEVVKPADQWNHIRLISNQGHVEHWLNGRKIVEVDMNSSEWRNLIAKSKFAEMDAFAQARKGKICLQDHGNPVSFRNIKIKAL